MKSLAATAECETNLRTQRTCRDTEALVRRVLELEFVDWGLSRTGDAVVFSSAKRERNSIHEMTLRDFSHREVLASPDADYFSPVKAASGWLALTDRLGDMVFRLSAPVDASVEALPVKQAVHALRRPDTVLLFHGPRDGKGAAVLRWNGSVWTVAVKASLGASPATGFFETRRGVLIGTPHELLCLDPDHPRTSRTEVPGGVYGICQGAAEDLIFGTRDGEWLELNAAQVASTDDDWTLRSRRPFLQTGRDKTLLSRYEDSVFFMESVDHRHVLRRVSVQGIVTGAFDTRGYVHCIVPIDRNRVLATFSGPNVSQQALMLFDLQRQEATDLLEGQAGVSLGDCRLERTSLGDCWVFRRVPNARGVVMYLHPAAPNEAIPRWLPELQLYLDRGYTVLSPNFRGSDGHGSSFATAGRLEIIRSLLDWLSWTEANFPGLAIGAHGFSSGGGLVEELATDHDTNLSFAVIHTPARPDAEGGPPSCPSLFLLGANDSTLHTARRQAALQKLTGHPNFFFRTYLREGHIFRERATLVDSLYAISGFLDTQVQRGAEPR